MTSVMAGGLILPLFKFERPERVLTGVREGGENNMRLDKYLKVSRLIKRRTIANEAWTRYGKRQNCQGII